MCKSILPIKLTIPTTYQLLYLMTSKIKIKYIIQNKNRFQAQIVKKKRIAQAKLPSSYKKSIFQDLYYFQILFS